MQTPGFTRRELVFVLGIAGVLWLLFLPTLMKSAKRGNEPNLKGTWFNTQRASCQNNLKQMGLVFKMYANESKGELYPPIQLEAPKGPTGDIFFAAGPRVKSIYPEFLSDPMVLLCPADPDGRTNPFKDKKTENNFDAYYVDAETRAKVSTGGVHVGKQEGVQAVDVSYIYLGWLFNHVSDSDPVDTVGNASPNLATLTPGMDPALKGATQLLKAFDNLALNFKTKGDAAANDDLDAGPGNGNKDKENTVFRLKDGLERLIITDTQNPAASARAQSEIFIMCDIPGDESVANHLPAGSNILYLDGHVEYSRFPSRPPTSQAFATMAQALTK